jgi:hypothetical protein
MRGGRKLALACAGAFALVGAAVAYATIPDANGVIHGCILTKQQNVLKVIDTDRGQTCGTGNVSLNWNQKGPPGPQGQQGPQGPTGPQGPQGATGTGNAVGMTGNGGLLSNGTMQAASPTLNIPSGNGSPHKVLLTGQVMISCITNCSDINQASIGIEIKDDTTRVNPFAAYFASVSESNTVFPYSFIAEAGEGSHPYHLEIIAQGPNQVVVQGPTLNVVDLGPTS